MKIRKVLCPIDFSKTAERALEYAEFMAASHEAELLLLNVVDQLHGLTPEEVLAVTPMNIAEKLAKRAHEDLQALVDRVRAPVSAAKAVRAGKPWVEICAAAKEEQADIIVIGSHGRTGLSHVLLGSVAETVVRYAGCPVLVVRESTH